MFKLKSVVPKNLIKDLVISSISGLEQENCYYDQFHYVNRNWVDKNIDFLTSVIAETLSEIHPGISKKDLSYVNDFVAPVNLENGQIHSLTVDNKYPWHVDGVDRWLGPCYNFWIPLYRQKAIENLDDRSVFDVIERHSTPSLYFTNGDPKTDYFLSSTEHFDEQKKSFYQDYLKLSAQELQENILLMHLTGETELIPSRDLAPTGVVRPEIGDAYVFASNQFHASGTSTFERIGISIKFIINNPNLGFRNLGRGGTVLQPTESWLDLFLSSYFQNGDFTSFRKYLDIAFDQEYVLTDFLHNKEKVDCILGVLEDIAEEV